MDIQLLAALLLVGRLISEFFISLVLLRQWKLRKTRTHPRLMQMRKVLTLLAVLVFIGNLFPLWLDYYTLANPEIRTSQTVNIVGVVYSLDNNLTFMFASVLIWTLYKLADVVLDVAELLAGRSLRTTIPRKK